MLMIFNVLFTVINVVSIIFITIIRINVKVLCHIFLHCIQSSRCRCVSFHCVTQQRRRQRGHVTFVLITAC